MKESEQKLYLCELIEIKGRVVASALIFEAT
jgi:hypothetical protein